MTLRQLQIELFRFGRRRVHEHQALTHLIEELMQRPQEATERNKFIRILVVRDALYLSHLAGLHGHCTELFLSTMRHTPNALPLSDAVVDSAFSHGSAAVMSAVVDASVSRLQHSPDDAGTEAALYRMVWLCALKSLELEEERAVLLRRSHGSQQQHVRSRSSSTSAVVSPQQEISELQEKRQQYENVARSAFVTLTNANPSIASTRSRATTETSLSTSSNFRSLSSSNSSMDDATATASSTSSAAAARPLPQLSPFDELWHSATRFARYHYTDDGGEAQFYKHLYDNDWLRNKQAPQMVSVLIRSCNRSQNVKLVKEYFTHFVKHVMERAAAEEEESQLLAAQKSEGSSHTTNLSTSDDVVRGGDDLKDQNDNTQRNKTSKFQEVVVHTYFQTLLNCRAYQAVVDAAENLFTHVDAYTPSTSILAVVSRAAGEVRNHRLAMHCASLLFASTTTAASQQNQNDEGTFGGSSGGGDAGGIVAEQQQDPSSSLGAASEKSLPSSYEVFVTLMALAKCHATSFLPLLEKVRAIAAISPNDEETLCLQLHYLRRSPHIASETNRILADIRAKPIASVTLLTVRNMTLILLLLQHCNHDQFLEVYREYVMRSSEKSHLWCLVLLQWAELRRYTLSNADRDFVIRTLRELQKEDEGELSKSTTNSKRGSSSSSTTSLWHTVTSWIAPSAGDTVLQRGAVAIFLADCCAMGRLHRTEAFATALSSSTASSSSSHGDEDDRAAGLLLPQWPLDDSSLRFTLKPSGKLSSGLRHNALAPDSLVRYNSIDVSSGLGLSMLDAQIMMHKGWDDDKVSATVGNGGGTQQLYTPRGEELSLILSSRAMVQSMMSFSN